VKNVVMMMIRRGRKSIEKGQEQLSDRKVHQLSKSRSKLIIKVGTLGSDILTPSNSPKLLTKKSRRSLNAFTMIETASPPAYPSPSAATPAFCAILLAPEVNWNKGN